MTLRDRLLSIEQELACASLEREDVIRGLMLALLAREHLFVLGPPGADKSRLIANLMNRIEGAKTFTLLLTRFTTPEEVIGPLSIPAYEKGFYARIIEGMLPEAQLAFLDEIFKANSAILNSLLMLMNERLYRNAGKLEQAPLSSLFAASNEMPQAEELSPLYDRLLLRFQVGYLGEEGNLLRMLHQGAAMTVSTGTTSTPTTMTLSDLEEAQFQVRRVAVAEEGFRTMLRIRAALKQAGLSVSDRRLKASIGIVKAQAWLSGQNTARDEDFEVLMHTLWQDPKDRRLVADRVLQVTSPATAKALEIRDLAAEQYRLALEKKNLSEAESAEAMTKLKSLVESIATLRRDLAVRGPVPEKIERAFKEVTGFRREVLRECLGIEV